MGDGVSTISLCCMMATQYHSLLPQRDNIGGFDDGPDAYGKGHYIFFLVSSIFLSWPILSSMGQENPASMADSAAIKQSVAKFIENFNRHDAHAAAMSFSEDADLTNVRGAVTHGRKAIDELYVGLFQGRLKDAIRTVAVTNIRYLTPEIASVDCTWEISGTRADNGSMMPVRHGILVLVMTKMTNGQWIMTVYHEPEFASASEK
jgi:uncharacterized protein (TIGR02246 family)